VPFTGCGLYVVDLSLRHGHPTWLELDGTLHRHRLGPDQAGHRGRQRLQGVKCINRDTERTGY
jgi:hypothetical protein